MSIKWQIREYGDNCKIECSGFYTKAECKDIIKDLKTKYTKRPVLISELNDDGSIPTHLLKDSEFHK